jgi:RIO-like serine/threonine protein kinase
MPERIPWDERSDAFVKETRRRRVLGLVRPSRARRAFEAARVLVAAGVPTAEPLECRDEGSKAVFVARFVDGAPLDVAKDGERAARLAARIHEAGVVHGDFKPANILVGRGGLVAKRELVVIDLDAAKVTKGPPSRRARARDLGALVAYAERLGVGEKKRRAIVAAYLDAAKFETDGAAFERAVFARSRTKLARWAQAR